jgi:hypothetical protein
VTSNLASHIKSPHDGLGGGALSKPDIPAAQPCCAFGFDL